MRRFGFPKQMTPGLLAHLKPGCELTVHSSGADIKHQLTAQFSNDDARPRLPIYESVDMRPLLDSVLREDSSMKGTYLQALDIYTHGLDTIFGRCVVYNLLTDPHATRHLSWCASTLTRDLLIDTYNYIATGNRMYSAREWFVRFRDAERGLRPADGIGVKCLPGVDELHRLSKIGLFTKWVGNSHGASDIIIIHGILSGQV